MLGKISFIVIVIASVVLAIMFDWFGSRELAQSGVEKAGVAVEKIEHTGDRVKKMMNDEAL